MTGVESRDAYLDSLLSGSAMLAQSGSAWQRSLRMRAVERANELVVPSTRDEEWRFTDLSPLYRMAFQPAAGAGRVDASRIGEYAFAEAHTRLVFVDGCYSPDQSRIRPEEGVTVSNLAGASPFADQLAESHLAKLALIDDDAFSAVNTAFVRDAALVHVARERAASAPIHLLFVATRGKGAAYPRVLVVAEAGSRCTVVEDFVGAADAPYLTVGVSEFYVGENAQVSHVRLQREAPMAFHIGTTAVRTQRAGRYAAWTVALGARISRHNLSIAQAGEATEFSVDGLALIGSRQLADMHSSIDHAYAYGRSRQLHKTIAGEGAHAVFNGKILVRQGAQHTDSGQQSRNLLLSDKARIDTKPQLEIFADDVKCAHGATVGQLDADELFYLKSRGLSEAAARSLLTYAFAAQVIEGIPVKSLVQRLEETVLQQTQRVKTP